MSSKLSFRRAIRQQHHAEYRKPAGKADYSLPSRATFSRRTLFSMYESNGFIAITCSVAHVWLHHLIDQIKVLLDRFYHIAAVTYLYYTLSTCHT